MEVKTILEYCRVLEERTKLYEIRATVAKMMIYSNHPESHNVKSGAVTGCCCLKWH